MRIMEIVEYPNKRRLDLKNILARFHTEKIGSPFDQPLSLNAIRLRHLEEGNVTQRWKFCRGPH